ncbi:MAG: ferrochelatase [Candidatus Bathyarchaeia archaeon]|jgi:ferrochelatase
MQNDKVAILLLAYGTPETEADIEPYLVNVRRGRPASPELVRDLKQRYSRIGGRSPLLEITKAQATALEMMLREQGFSSARTYVGMKHWHPYIREVVPEILRNNHDALVALTLAPHFSIMSIGGYKNELEEALGRDSKVKTTFIESWHDNPLFHKAVAEKVKNALSTFSSQNVNVIFTAHSLPERILEMKDPYPEQLGDSSEAVAKLVGLEKWSFAYQSAGQTGEKWLGPDLLEALQETSVKTENAQVLVVPIGFVADHLEILFDIDIEAQEYAKKLKITLKRTESMNTTPTFIAALADVVGKRIG